MNEENKIVDASPVLADTQQPKTKEELRADDEARRKSINDHFNGIQRSDVWVKLDAGPRGTLTALKNACCTRGIPAAEAIKAMDEFVKSKHVSFLGMEFGEKDA